MFKFLSISLEYVDEIVQKADFLANKIDSPSLNLKKFYRSDWKKFYHKHNTLFCLTGARVLQEIPTQSDVDPEKFNRITVHSFEFALSYFRPFEIWYWYPPSFFLYNPVYIIQLAQF